MTSVLKDLSLPAMGRAVEENWRAGFVEMIERWQRGVIYEEPDLLWYGSPVADPLLNGVLRSRFEPDLADAAIIRTLAPFRDRKVPLWWWLFPGSEPADLGARLEQHGLIREQDLPGMAVDLRELPAAVRMPAGFTVQPVEDLAGLRLWAEVCSRGMPQSPPAAEAHVEIFGELGFGPGTGWRHYVGWWGGRPVACCSAYRGAGVVGLYYVAVLPDARGQGIGAAMALAPLREGLDEGYRVGVLQATRMGMPVYQRLGFRQVSSFPQYRWDPEE